MGRYDHVADLPLTVETVSFDQYESDTSSGFTRTTTVFALDGGGETGRGEDVTYDTEDHEALSTAGLDLDLAGEYTVATFSDALDALDLFPTGPERETARHYRRWALESAALDLALRQADTHLGAVLDRERDPVRFVVSTRLGDPPTTDRVDAIRDRAPDAEFKFDPTASWTDDLVSALAATGAVRILDLKGHYEGTEVDQAPDPTLYERVLDGFPDAVIEDPALTDETRALFDDHHDRVAWDAPITGVESIEALPWEPTWLNIKPSRFGTIESLFETLDYAQTHDIRLYGGGQFELDVGRDHIQLLASLFYPDGPNDVAPGVYNRVTLPDHVPRSPLTPATNPVGLSFSP